MQTNFSKNQLKDKDNKSSEKILRKCVHCGFCNATCPTYQLLGDELDGPRGRIYLIKDMLENKKPANEKIVKHIDRCLSCYSCMTTCPSGVNYMHLIDHGRKYIEKTYNRPFKEKLLRNFLSTILPKRGLFRFFFIIAKLLKPISFIFPKKIKNMFFLLPSNVKSSCFKNKEIYPAETNKRVARVALLTGCVQTVLSPQINDSTIRVLNRHGVEVVNLKKINCCGSLDHHMGKEDLATSVFKQNILAWHDEYLNKGLDAIISNTSGCGTTLKDYGFIFREDKEFSKKAKKISDLTKDISEYLSENIKLKFNQSEKEKIKSYRIAYHSACSMQHGQKIHKEPIDLIRKTGNEVCEIPNGHLCCGSAGTYNMLQHEIADKLLDKKIENINKIKPAIISTGNIGCINQIAKGTNIPILHTIELIDWYTGGPKPDVLKRL